MKYGKWMAILAVLVMGISPMVHAFGGGAGEQHHYAHMSERWEKIGKRLDLSEDQMVKLNDINKAYKLKHLDVKEKLQPFQIKVQKAMAAETIDTVQLRQLMNDAAPYYVEMVVVRTEHFEEIKTILTDKQRLRLEKHRGKILKKMAKHRGADWFGH